MYVYKNHTEMTSSGKSTITSDYGMYVKRHLSPVLVRALAEIAECRPKDPIEYLANFLHHHREKNPEEREITETERENMITLDNRDRNIEDSVSIQADHVHVDCLKQFYNVGDIFDETDLS